MLLSSGTWWSQQLVGVSRSQRWALMATLTRSTRLLQRRLLLIMSVPQVTQLGRDVQASLYDVFWVPAGSHYASMSTKQGRRYAVAIQDNHGHGLGPPHLFVIRKMHIPAEIGASAPMPCSQDVQPGLSQNHPCVWELRSNLLQILEQNWKRKQGTSPAGNLERKIASWQEEMVS